MINPLEKALSVVKNGTDKALTNLNRNNNTSMNNNNMKAKSSRRIRHKLHGKKFDPYDHKYQQLKKRGFKYSTNQLAKYVYRTAGSTKYKNPNRRIKKLIMRKHNRLVLSRLSSDDKWDLPCVTYKKGVRYYYVNALQFVYLIARSHRGCAIELRETLAEVAQAIISEKVKPGDVIKAIRQAEM